MDQLRYYASVFLRRLPYFLIVATVIAAVSFTVALSLPPAYVSQMRLVVESPQIPSDLAASTVQTPALEQLQIVQQRLLTRENLLDIQRRLKVLSDADKMNPDEIVNAMRARTDIRTSSGRNEATMMTVSFEASDPRDAAGVLNEYLTLIQQEDAQFRRGRAGETLAFFRQEVQRLGQELDGQSAEILRFKQKNTDALPESLDFRMSQQASIQERLSQLDRELTSLQGQRDRLIQLFEVTGGTGQDQQVPLSPQQAQLRDLREQLNEALAVYSSQNPRVKMLEARIAALEQQLAPDPAGAQAGAETPEGGARAPTMLDVQLAELDSRREVMESQRATLSERLDALNASITRTPEVSITLADMERRYEILQSQYNSAQERLGRAQTGDLIETRSRGQRISVIEQPAVPSQPTKPNRVLIAGGGSFFGILAGAGLILLMEVLNGTARRPEDLVRRFGVTPFTTVPYIRTRRQMLVQRSFKVLVILTILIGIPLIIYAVHLYYLPLDLIAEKVMNKIGIRW